MWALPYNQSENDQNSQIMLRACTDVAEKKSTIDLATNHLQNLCLLQVYFTAKQRVKSAVTIQCVAILKDKRHAAQKQHAGIFHYT